jgi:hypothetical protein
VKALFDYDGLTEQEISFREGDEFELFCFVNDDWLRVSLNDDAFLAPVSYFEIIIPEDFPDPSGIFEDARQASRMA